MHFGDCCYLRIRNRNSHSFQTRFCDKRTIYDGSFFIERQNAVIKQHQKQFVKSLAQQLFPLYVGQ